MTVSVFAQSEGVKDVKMEDKIDGAIQLYASDSEAAYNTLIGMGANAIPRLLQIIEDDYYFKYSLVFKKSRLNPFLLSVIEKDSSDVSEGALIGLSMSSDIMIKGMAVLSLGEKKSTKAIPCLIRQ